MKNFIKDTFTLGDTKVRNQQIALNIAYGVDKNFIFGTAISITSVLINNEDIPLAFHIFTDSIDSDNLDKFNQLAKLYNTMITVYIIDPMTLSYLPVSDFWSHAIYFRLLAFDYLSNILGKVLYVDADIVCKGSLSSLLKISLEEKFSAVVPDLEKTRENSAKRLGVEEFNETYFNSGLIYANLNKWEENNLSEYIFLLLKGNTKFGNLKYFDQDALNIAFGNNNIYLSRDFNCIYSIKNELKARNNSDYKNTIKESTVFIHYTGVTKPWHKWASYESTSFFHQALLRSPWKDSPLKDASTRSEYQKRYKHELRQRKYIYALMHLINYKLKH
ncbi:glycosyltransferase family 8 protein [Erwinia sp. HR93]|uniref:glycosyltransferase family 8 protein n=1 Tax=Erwinia sp. HR93 TaxID=3094840 RepID=UPI002ADEA70F|nr:glycosyltransferase [Erwinia sp. HR93]MEA1062824.1 glycosyltransferase [Erwinia sp. HR93]